MEDEAIGLAIHCGCSGMEGECGEAESGGEQDGFGKMHEESVLAAIPPFHDKTVKGWGTRIHLHRSAQV